MKLFRCLLLVCPAACLLAQTPPPKPAEAAPPAKPGINLSVDKTPPAMPEVPPDTVVLTVGDIKLTAAQFDQIISVLPAQYQAAARGPGRKQFADNLVRMLVLAQEGKRRKLDETPTYQSQAMFEQANVLAGLTYKEISKENKVDDAEMQKYYDAHKAEFEEVQARHILIRMQGSPLAVKPGQKDLTDAEALAKAQDLRNKLVGGADFAALAMQESDDNTTAPRGGDLGFFHHNQMVPAFDEAAFKLNVGELSEPVKTPFGYHLIKVEAKRTKSLEDMKPELEKRLGPEVAQKAMDEMEKKSNVVLDPTFFNLPKK
jgi:peptidyl-prolyl cis-trans isomerase C